MDKYSKLEALQIMIRSMGKVTIAFSGGVDSTFLLKVAHDIVGNGVTAITVVSPTYPVRELHRAQDFLRENGIKSLVLDIDEVDIAGFMDNPPNRCYLCKRVIFSEIIAAASQIGIGAVVDGTNADDENDYRPGMQALDELGIKSPLRMVGLTKLEIRSLSKQMHLPTWDKPSLACLASRFPYGEKISREKLSMVDKSEQYLLDRGFTQVRVRYHGDLARIEVSPAERTWFGNETLMDEVNEEFKRIGFAYTALDLKGYRTGSMNEPIVESQHI